jgi:uncharacterized membrane protein YphA (DoxX/SURF4 family)
MRTAIQIIRYFVGILFIISGLVKANDPLGLGYNMQEFFEIWNTGLASSHFFLRAPLISLFTALHEHSLALSVIMIALEIMAGIALLLGWKKKPVLNLLLVLIVFFTFLTAYAFLSGKFKNCGCFGDCLPITPLTSFLKDVVLLILIVLLAVFKKYVVPVSTPPVRSSILILFLLISFGFQWYVLNYLPVADCLPFKKGNSIAEQMKIPAGAVPDSFAIRFIYEKGGKRFEFSPDQLPADLNNYTFVDRTDKLVRKGNAEPPIKGFALTGPDMDSTQIVLNQPVCVLLFYEGFDNKAAPWINNFKEAAVTAQSKNIPVYVATSSSIEKATEFFKQTGINNLQIFTCDNTAIRTAARTNPTLYILKKGVVDDKYSFREIDEAASRLKKL